MAIVSIAHDAPLVSSINIFLANHMHVDFSKILENAELALLVILAFPRGQNARPFLEARLNTRSAILVLSNSLSGISGVL